MTTRQETQNSSKFFNANKSKSNEFFKDTKVGSASHVIVKNGQSIAVPFSITNSKGKGLLSYKNAIVDGSDKKTIYQ